MQRSPQPLASILLLFQTQPFYHTGLAIDGRLKKEKANLAASTIIQHQFGSKENLGIIISYQVSVFAGFKGVKLCFVFAFKQFVGVLISVHLSLSVCLSVCPSIFLSLCAPRNFRECVFISGKITSSKRWMTMTIDNFVSRSFHTGKGEDDHVDGSKCFNRTPIHIDASKSLFSSKITGM